MVNNENIRYLNYKYKIVITNNIKYILDIILISYNKKIMDTRSTFIKYKSRNFPSWKRMVNWNSIISRIR